MGGRPLSLVVARPEGQRALLVPKAPGTCIEIAENPQSRARLGLLRDRSIWYYRCCVDIGASHREAVSGVGRRRGPPARRGRPRPPADFVRRTHMNATTTTTAAKYLSL